VVSFARFHDRGFGTLADKFIAGSFTTMSSSCRT
jgi:hypothetical protein